MALEFDLNHYQAEFVASQGRFPCLITGVGTGKTFAALLKCWIHAESYPNANVMIVRKEFTDLRDSTMADFNTYFNTNVTKSTPDYKFPNGSKIMFRHGNLNDISVLKNVNLSMAMIEQAEEYENAEVFNYLRDRLRRTQVPIRQMCIIANANGMNWVWELWVKNATEVIDHSKEVKVLSSLRSTGEMYYKHHDTVEADPEQTKDADVGLVTRDDGTCFYQQDWECWTANSFINAHNLPVDTLIDWASMEKTAPNHYRRMIQNSFDQMDDDDNLLTSEDIQLGLHAEFLYVKEHYIEKILAVDIARFGNDKCAAVVLEQRGPMHWEMTLVEQWEQKDLMYSVGRILDLRARLDTTVLVVDGEGMGGGVVDRLKENGIEVVEYRGGMTRTMKDKTNYADRNTEDAFKLKELIQSGRLKIMQEIVAEAQTVRYEYSSSGGKKKMVSKSKLRAQGVKSPNIFDSLRMAVSQTDNVKSGSYKGRRRQPMKAVAFKPMAGLRGFRGQ